jgi:hypothetical protein
MGLLLKQLFRGLMAIVMALSAFAFVWLLQLDSYLGTTSPFERALQPNIISSQKQRIDEAIDALALKNKFDSEPIKPLITQKSLLHYNLRIVTWWQAGLATDAQTPIPVFDSTYLAPGFENQEGLDARKKLSSSSLVQKLIADNVFLANESLTPKLIDSVSTAKYMRLIPYIKIALIAVFAVSLLLLLLSSLRQISLLLWFFGLATFLSGSLSLTTNLLIRSFDIAQRIGAYNESLKALAAALVNQLHTDMNTISLLCLGLGAAMMVGYAILSRILRKVKAFITA